MEVGTDIMKKLLQVHTSSLLLLNHVIVVYKLYFRTKISV